ncbi:MAG: hypothetical protein KKD18_00480 [Nanoarchaeota archaeon]|nr:hypothetical protein [Nanoarchaeota archaeon]
MKKEEKIKATPSFTSNFLKKQKEKIAKIMIDTKIIRKRETCSLKNILKVPTIRYTPKKLEGTIHPLTTTLPLG